MAVRCQGTLPTALMAILMLAWACSDVEPPWLGEVDEAALVLPVVRDAALSAVEGERSVSADRALDLKVKGTQELAIIDIPVDSLKGRVVSSAKLLVYVTGSERLRRVSVSTVSAAWIESGLATPGRVSQGVSFASSGGGKPWAFPGSDVTAVINGVGNSIWKFSEPREMKARGWVAIPVDPLLVAARVADVSFGFSLTDDVGNEYERTGDAIRYRYFPNREFSSRHRSSRKRPAMVVETAGSDHQPPNPVQFVPSGEPLHSTFEWVDGAVAWFHPKDNGRSGTVGYHARVQTGGSFDWESSREVPQYLVPLAGAPGEVATLSLSDLDLESGQRAILAVRAVDGAGNAGPISTLEIQVGKRRGFSISPLEPSAGVSGKESSLTNEEQTLFAVDALDKVHPVKGLIGHDDERLYKVSNHLWDAESQEIRLAAGRNEFVDFQVVIQGVDEEVEIEVEFWTQEGTQSIEAGVFRFGWVDSELGALPDPLIPIESGHDSGSVAPRSIPGRQYGSYYVELFVPHSIRAGKHDGVLRIRRGADETEIEIDLTVWDFTLPDRLSFIPQMNAYVFPPDANIREYYRLAHRNRTCLNRLTYSWDGSPCEGCAPTWDGSDFDWDRWDRLFGPLLDGSAFADLPRASVPVDAFYLPINENWPVKIESGFEGGYWADLALGATYRDEFTRAVGRLTQHMVDQGWEDTFFEFYLNNRITHKEGNWSNSSAPWNFDEPMNTQDFWALRWFGKAFHSGVLPTLGKSGGREPKMVFRCDISRPEWQRDLLDGIQDINAVGPGFVRYRSLNLARKLENRQILYSYGDPNSVEGPNVLPVLWSLRTWCLGGDGVIPWQTIGDDQSWSRADTESLFYPARFGSGAPYPSIRLKAFRRGQQDVEYLVLLMQVLEIPRSVLGEEVLEALRIDWPEGGRLDSPVDPGALWAIRQQVGQALDREHPLPKKRLVELRTPPREALGLDDEQYFSSPAVVESEGPVE